MYLKLFPLRLLPRIPSLVSWVVSPSTGVAPYVLTAVFNNKELLDGVNYRLESAIVDNVGSCVTNINAGVNDQARANTILATNGLTAMQTVNTGSCRAFILRIRDIPNNTIIQGLIAHVDNV